MSYITSDSYHGERFVLQFIRDDRLGCWVLQRSMRRAAVPAIIYCVAMVATVVLSRVLFGTGAADTGFIIISLLCGAIATIRLGMRLQIRLLDNGGIDLAWYVHGVRVRAVSAQVDCVTVRILNIMYARGFSKNRKCCQLEVLDYWIITASGDQIAIEKHVQSLPLPLQERVVACPDKRMGTTMPLI